MTMTVGLRAGVARADGLGTHAVTPKQPNAAGKNVAVRDPRAGGMMTMIEGAIAPRETEVRVREAVIMADGSEIRGATPKLLGAAGKIAIE